MEKKSLQHQKKKKNPTKVELKKTHTVNNNVISFYGDRC